MLEKLYSALRAAVTALFMACLIGVVVMRPASAKTPKLPAVTVTRHLTIMPPPEFDKPYEGKLFIVRLATEEEIHTICPNYGKTTHFTACARWSVSRDQCFLYIAGDRVLKAVGVSYALALRHEIAHCNGWGPDHKDGKKVSVDYSVAMPKLPVSTKYLPLSPPVICVTPDWQPESCEERKSKDIWTTVRPFQKSDIK